LAAAIAQASFDAPICPVYQNVNAHPTTDPATIKELLIQQLTAPVRWTQIMENMLTDGCTEVVEVGPGKVLQGLFKKVNRELNTSSASIESQG
jgi:[acyl-carrier-protein] S-malonyltransferase